MTKIDEKGLSVLKKHKQEIRKKNSVLIIN